MTFLIFIIVGIVLIVIGIIYAMLDSKAQKRCSEKVKGKVCDYLVSYSTNEEGETVVYYSPVYEYTYNGQLYTVDNNSYTTSKQYPVGFTFDLFINPFKPEETYIYSDSFRGIIKALLIIGGVICIIYSFTKL